MPFDMVHTDQRNSRCEADRLGRRHPYQQRTHQSRPIGHCDGIHFLQSLVRTAQCLCNHLIDSFNMLPGGYLRNHTAI